MHDLGVRKWAQLGYVCLLTAMAITLTGCPPTVSTAVCGNGAVEAGEECDPPNSDTCDIDCTIIEDTGPVCGNGEVENGEECEPPDTETCDANCQAIDVVVPVCGNGEVEADEDCEPPGTETCDANCQTIDVVADGLADKK